MERKKIIRIIDIVLIGVTLVGLMFAFRYVQPRVIAPIDEYTTKNSSVLFTFEKGNVIYIDDNRNFTSPEKIFAQDNLVIRLDPGVYYWKVAGLIDSEVRTLTIVSTVDLKLRDAGDNYEVVNAGNTRLNVDVYNGTEYNGNFTLLQDESANVSGTRFVGRQYE